MLGVTGWRDSKSLTHEFIYPTDSTRELLQRVLEDVERIFRVGYRYRRAGVLFHGLVPTSELTGRLFDNETLERFRRVMPTIDSINKKSGKDTIRFAIANPAGRWKTKAARSSLHYTTRFTDLPVIQ